MCTVHYRHTLVATEALVQHLTTLGLSLGSGPPPATPASALSVPNLAHNALISLIMSLAHAVTLCYTV